MTASFKPLSKNEPPKPTSHHQRFIPREEISEFDSWSFGAVDGSDIPPPVDKEAEIAAERAIQDRIDHAVREARQQAYAEGHEQGRQLGAKETREALEATIRKTAEQAGVRMAQLLHNVTDQLRRAEDGMAHQMLELACEIARQVLRQELSMDKKAVHLVTIEALSQLIDDGLPASVRMNPVDHALMKGALEENLSKHPIELIADPSITPGGCMVESPSTSVDATLEKRWKRAIGNIGMDMPWNPEAADE
ncbi:flagellar assembly protein FliH [Hydrogenophaga sp. 5NK40-0174]|uniref:FliH/SctL family protein n=1 Tax=Hydrogenophaga sp. 5NK40-0174 TaxID=3127649 RepID=UPI003109F0AD